MSRMRKQLFQVADFASRQVLRNTEFVRLEGGLGSQILGAIEYFYREYQAPTKRILIDDSYFNNQSKKTDPKISQWTYQLSRYGIYPEDFNNSKDVSFFLASRISRADWVTPETWSYVNSELSSKFELQKKSAEKELAKLAINSNYGVLHVRRGDYTYASSKLISHKENYNLLSRLESSCGLPENFIITTDSKLSPESEEMYRSIGSKIHLLDNHEIEAGVMHDLMRMSKILVTSNSTYSFSAGILADDDCLVVSPLNFFKESNSRSASLNEFFRSAGNFVVQNTK